jgi:sterol desaturase/sphingolipid hydroxylase (fatty acid hydroxylase superfamily)
MLEGLNPIGLAVPIFLGLIGLEYAYSRWHGLENYRFNDAIAALTCGMGDQLLSLIFGAVGLGAYHQVYSHLGLFEMDVSAPSTWVVGVLGVDLLYYVFHRFGHRVNIGWAVHSVHHQSEEYNLAVALRQPWFAQIYSWIFYLPLALVGLPTAVWAGSFSINLLYQFWIHTRVLPKLGPLEWVMNTPSHHRVHHGVNTEYLDKNYAGIFIIWDRLFGTFEPEFSPVVYGVLKPVRTWDPVRANLLPLAALLRQVSGQERWVDKLRMWVAAPGWSPGAALASSPAHQTGITLARGYDLNVGRDLSGYIIANLVGVAIVTGFVIAYADLWPGSWLASGTIYIVWTGLNWGRMQEGRAHAKRSEWLRLGAFVLLGFWAALTLSGPLARVGWLLGLSSLLAAAFFAKLVANVQKDSI